MNQTGVAPHRPDRVFFHHRSPPFNASIRRLCASPGLTDLPCRIDMLKPRSQTPLTMTPTTPEVPTTTCRPLTTTRSSLGGSQAGGMRLFRSVSQFVLAILWQLV
ncbi:hypothetical protein ACQJBY_048564 [Aegilops geniculata]